MPAPLCYPGGKKGILCQSAPNKVCLSVKCRYSSGLSLDLVFYALMIRGSVFAKHNKNQKNNIALKMGR